MTDRDIEKEILEGNKLTLDKSPINSLTPVRSQSGEIYFITKLKPDLIRELIEEKKQGELSSTIKASISSYLENEDNAIFRIDFLDYPFYFEAEFYQRDIQKEYILQMLEQDKFGLFFIVQYADGSRELITKKMFNIRPAMLTAFKRLAQKKDWL